MLDQLTPQQRKLAMVGIPVVAVFALISVIQKRNQPVPTTPPTTGFMPGGHAPSTDAIGVGQLAEFESILTGQITQLARQVGELKANPAPSTPTAPAPAPAAKTLPNVSHEWFPAIAPQGEDFSVLGTITGNGFKGYNVGGGVPVYAFEGGQWRQYFDAAKLQKGTVIGIPEKFESYIDMANPVS